MGVFGLDSQRCQQPGRGDGGKLSTLGRCPGADWGAVRWHLAERGGFSKVLHGLW